MIEDPRQRSAHMGRRDGAVSFGWLVGDRFIRLGVAFVVGAMVARYLGPHEFGRLSYAASWLAVIGVLVPLGLDGILRREVIQRPDSADEVIGTVFGLKLLALAIGLCVAVALVGLAPSEDRLLLLATCGGMVMPIAATYDVVLESSWLGRQAFLARFASTTAGALIRVLLIVVDARTEAFALVVTIESVLLVVATALAFKEAPVRGGLRQFKPAIALRLLKEAWPLILAALSVALYSRVDQLMLRHYLGDAAVGSYAAAVRLSEIGHFVPMLAAATLFPAIASAGRRGPVGGDASVQQYLDGSALAGYASAVVLSAGSTFWVSLVYGHRFSESAAVLGLHAWTSAFVYLGVARSQVLILRRDSLIQLLTTVAGAITSIAANLVMLPRVGVIGAAVAAVCAQACASWLSLGLFPSSRDLFRQIGLALLVPFRWRALSELARDGLLLFKA